MLSSPSFSKAASTFDPIFGILNCMLLGKPRSMRAALTLKLYQCLNCVSSDVVFKPMIITQYQQIMKAYLFLPPIFVSNKEKSSANGRHIHGCINLFYIRGKPKFGNGFRISRQNCTASNSPVLLTCMRKTILTGVLLYTLHSFILYRKCDFTFKEVGDVYIFKFIGSINRINSWPQRVYFKQWWNSTVISFLPVVPDREKDIIGPKASEYFISCCIFFY